MVGADRPNGRWGHRCTRRFSPNDPNPFPHGRSAPLGARRFCVNHRSGGGRIRTSDQRIMSPLLSPLSYTPGGAAHATGEDLVSSQTESRSGSYRTVQVPRERHGLSIATHPPDHELFQGVAAHDLAGLEERAPALAFAKGELIYSPYDRGDALYLVESGPGAALPQRLTTAASSRWRCSTRASRSAWSPLHGDELHDAYAEAMIDCVRAGAAGRRPRARRSRPPADRAEPDAVAWPSGCATPRISSRAWPSAACPRGWPRSCSS